MDGSRGVRAQQHPARESRVTVVTRLPLAHLRRLTGAHGLFEHARGDTPRLEHGYTVDDNARAVVLLSTAAMTRIDEYSLYLQFVLDSRSDLGWRNRMSAEGVWTDVAGPDDTTGRAFWALGTALAAGRDDQRIIEGLESLSNFRSSHLRASCYALLGAAATLRSGVMVDTMADFVASTLSRIPGAISRHWPWPEARLTYANARVPQALIEAGDAIGDAYAIVRGLVLLDWLVETETGVNGFSFTPVTGRGPGEKGPAFDQQPVEAWAMADACAAAGAVTGHPRWRHAVIEAGAWFYGRNDVGADLFDPVTGAGFDGLHRDGVNQNRGAESTLSALGAQVRFDEVF